ncbi:MAG: stage II sporulation protein D [Oscillospiraceae bacterium]|nr:stage II sporulation protein D [Oscillospiraceae bacterium]
MKPFLSFFALFSLVVFLLPLAALNPDKPLQPGAETNQPVSAASVPPIRQEESPVSPTAGDAPSEPAQEALSAQQVPQPESFSILDRSTGKIEKIPVLDYLYGAVAAELPPGFHAEAMKAQAIASHTYGLYCHAHPDPQLNGADFSADPSNWEGYVTQAQMLERYPDLGETYWKKITDAVNEVAAAVLVYQEEPILAAYHSMSAGATEFASNVWNGSVPYLVPADSVGDTLANAFETTVSFAAEQIKGILTEAYPDLTVGGDTRSWFQIVSRSPSGYVLTLQVGNLQISGKDLRTLLGLRSTNFTIAAQIDSFLFTTRGYGHGVGLSQYGADYMARQGNGYEAILLHYYTGVQLAQAADE